MGTITLQRLLELAHEVDCAGELVANPGRAALEF
jgi:hypothetical protein